VVVQPTHLLYGLEYDKLKAGAEALSGGFETLAVGRPLLADTGDIRRFARCLSRDCPAEAGGAVVFMGHGTEAASNVIYARMQQVMTDAGYANYFIGTVEAAPTAEDLVKLVKEGGYEKVILRPMMIVAGDHANNDMAGDDEDTWKTAFEGAGYQVECVLKGLGEYEAIQQLLVDHVKDAVAK